VGAFSGGTALARKKVAPEWAKLLTGQLGISAVLANVLIDKGIIGRDELCERLRQAQAVARRSAGGEPAARSLAAMISYLEKADRPRSH
jgi:hypothetical protein